MQENVLITFASDSGDLDVAVSKYKQLSAEEKKLAAEAKKAEEALKRKGDTEKKVNNDTSKGVDNQKKSIAQLAIQYGSLDKVISEGAMNTSLKGVLKELTIELAKLEAQGKQDTEEFRKLRDVAGEVKDTMEAVSGRIKDAGSDTRGLDGVISVAESVAAGFSLAQGAASLFGASSKDLEKAIIPLQSSMAILMGLTQLQNAIQKESVQMRVIETIQTKAGAAATRLDSAAKSTNIVVSKGATAAQWLLNAAMNANPVLLLVTGIGLLVGALSLFILAGESAAEKQEKLNNKLQAGLDLYKQTSERLMAIYEDINKYFTRQIELYAVQGKSLEEIQRLERVRSESAVDGANDQILANKRLIDSLEDNEYKINSINDALNRFANGDKLARVSVEVDGKIVDFKLSDEDEKKNLETLKGILQEQVTLAKASIDSKKEAESKYAVEELERQKKLNESKLKGTIAYYEAVAIQSQQGSYKEYKAQEMAMIDRAILEKESVKSSNASESEKANQIVRINSQLLKDLKNLKDAYEIEQISRQKNAIDAELALVQEESKQEYDLKIKSLEKQRSIDLISAKDNTSKKQLIEASYQREVKRLTDEYNQRILEDYVSAEEAKVNIRLTRVQKGSDDELKLKEDLIDLQADAEANSIAYSEKNEELRRLKIQAVYAKALQDKQQLERDKANAEIEYSLNSKNLDRESDRVAIEKQISQSFFFEWGKRAELEGQLHDQKLKAIDDERKAFEDKLSKQIISQQEYNSKMSELNNSQAQLELESINQIEQAKAEIRQAALDAMIQSVNSFYDAKKERLQQDLDDVTNGYTTDVEEAKTSANKKLITEQEMKRRQLEIKREIAAVDKQQALFGAFVNMALGITKALSSAPPPYNLILAAITAAASMVQINAINSRPLPKYWKGRKGGNGEYGWVGENGPEMMWIPSGASIIPAHKSRIVNEALDVMTQYKIPRVKAMDIQMASMPREVRDRIIERSTPIDYDMLADAIASKIDNKSVHVNMDKNGFSTYLSEGRDRKSILNNSYSLNL